MQRFSVRRSATRAAGSGRTSSFQKAKIEKRWRIVKIADIKAK